MGSAEKLWKGVVLCFAISVPCWFLGQAFPVVGGPIFAIIVGMVIARFLPARETFADGISFSSKKLLQLAVILLGFGLDLSVVVKTGIQSLPIILTTIVTALLVAHLLKGVLSAPDKVATLVGVGSSICGGSAIAACAPVLEADDDEIAQAMSVVFFFNLVAALSFPALGAALGFDTSSGEAFGIFAGTAVNDTSSVTATASTWDTLYTLGSATLDKAVTVKLTRTLAIIPITLVLAYIKARKDKSSSSMSLKKIFPTFILWFVLASLITTLATLAGVSSTVFAPLKTLSKYLIVVAMVAIGLNTDIVKLFRTGAKPLALGFACWISIIVMSLVAQKIMGIW